MTSGPWILALYYSLWVSWKSPETAQTNDGKTVETLDDLWSTLGPTGGVLDGLGVKA